MSETTHGALLRIYIGESAREGGHPLSHWILNAAMEAGLAGATVLRGVAGYGGTQQLHRAGILRLSEDLPLVVEIVDTEAKIEAFLPRLETVKDDALITLERVTVLR